MDLKEAFVTYYVGILDGEGEVWGVRIPDLPGCFGGGSTPEAAIADATSAAGEWAAYMIKNGFAVNAPRAANVIVADPDVEFDSKTEIVHLIPLIVSRHRQVKANISMDAGALEAIDAAAKHRGLTRSNFIVGTMLDKIAEDA
jgi:predicted RNase H-like HicB family nuclease